MARTEKEEELLELAAAGTPQECLLITTPFPTLPSHLHQKLS